MKRERIEAVKPEAVDYLARKVLMSAVLYYGLDSPLVSDDQYDAWCRAVKRGWDHLDPIRQWQMRDPEGISTGFDFRITQATVGGTWSWLSEHGLMGEDARTVVPSRDWKWSKKQRVHYLYPEDFRLMGK